MTVLRMNHRIKWPIWVIALLTMMLGVVMSISAALVSMKGYGYLRENGEAFCATGSITFMVLGIMITIVVQPILGIIGGVWVNRIK